MFDISDRPMTLTAPKYLWQNVLAACRPEIIPPANLAQFLLEFFAS